MACLNHTQLTLTETYYNMDVIKTLLNVNCNHPDYDHDNLMWESEQNKLKNIMKHSKDGINKVVYKLKNYNVGRMYPTPFKDTYQSMYSKIRRLVIDGNMTSLDIVNCHPSILKQLMERHTIYKYKLLNEYVSDRDKFRSIIMKEYGVSKEVVKELFIIMLFGGSHQTWFKEHGITKEPIKLITDFNNDVFEIMNTIAPQYFPDYVKYEEIAKKENAKKGKKNANLGANRRTALALYLQDIERKIVLSVYDYCLKHDIVVESLIHDELLIKGDVKINIDEVVEYVWNHTSYGVTLECKSTTPSEDDKKWFDDHLKFVDNSFNEDQIMDVFKNLKTFSDYEYAVVLHELYKEKFVSVSINDKWMWFEFRNHRWVECKQASSLKSIINTEVYKNMMKMSSAYAKQAANAEDNSDEQDKYNKKCQEIASQATKIRNIAKKNNIIAECALLFEKQFEDFYEQLNEKRNLIGFNNGVFDLKTGQFREGRPDDLLTFSTKYDYTPIVDEEVRDYIMQFVSSIMKTTEMEHYLLCVLAYMLGGQKFLEECFIMTGAGGNGKGVLKDLLKMTLGDYFYEPDISIFTQKKTDSSKANSEIAKAKGVRLLMSSEPEDGDKLQIGRLKLFTGGDQIQARQLYKEAVEFKPQFGIMLQTNGIPELSKLDGGIARRLRLIKFPFNFVDKPVSANEKKIDSSLKSKFSIENIEYAQQFMLILLEYYSKYIKNINKLDTPDEVMQFTNDYLESQDAVGQFIKDHCEITDNRKDKILSSEMYAEFKNSEHYVQGIDNKEFHKQMRAKNLERKKQMGMYYYVNVKLCVKDTSEIKQDSDDELF